MRGVSAAPLGPQGVDPAMTLLWVVLGVTLPLLLAPSVRRPASPAPWSASPEGSAWRLSLVTLIVGVGAWALAMQWRYELAGARAELQTPGGVHVVLRGASAACRWPGGVPARVDTLEYGLVGVGQAQMRRREASVLVRLVPPACPEWADGELRPRS